MTDLHTFEFDTDQLQILVNALSFYVDAIENLSCAITIRPTQEYATALAMWKKLMVGKSPE